MKKIMYLFALLSAMTLVSCEKSSGGGGGGGGGGTSGGGGSTTVAGSRPDTDKTQLWMAGESGTDSLGYINANGKMVIPAVYSAVYNFSSGVAMVDKDGEMFFIDQNGKTLGTLPANVKPNSYYFYYNRLPFTDTDTKKAGQLDLQYNVAVPAEYYKIGHSGDNGYSWCTVSGGLLGFVDQDGKQVIPEQYLICYTFYDGVTCVAFKQNSDTLWTVIDETGKNLFDPQPKRLYCMGKGLFGYKEGSLWGLMDKNGNVLTEAVYSTLWEFGDDVARVMQNDKYGFVNTRGEEIIPPIYGRSLDFNSGYCWVSKSDDDPWELINKKGETQLTLPSGTRALQIRNGLSLVTKWVDPSIGLLSYSYIDTKGNTIYEWTMTSSSSAPMRKSLELETPNN